MLLTIAPSSTRRNFVKHLVILTTSASDVCRARAGTVYTFGYCWACYKGCGNKSCMNHKLTLCHKNLVKIILRFFFVFRFFLKNFMSCDIADMRTIFIRFTGENHICVYTCIHIKIS